MRTLLILIVAVLMFPLPSVADEGSCAWLLFHRPKLYWQGIRHASEPLTIDGSLVGRVVWARHEFRFPDGQLGALEANPIYGVVVAVNEQALQIRPPVGEVLSVPRTVAMSVPGAASVVVRPALANAALSLKARNEIYETMPSASHSQLGLMNFILAFEGVQAGVLVEEIDPADQRRPKVVLIREGFIDLDMNKEMFIVHSPLNSERDWQVSLHRERRYKITLRIF